MRQLQIPPLGVLDRKRSHDTVLGSLLAREHRRSKPCSRFRWCPDILTFKHHRMSLLTSRTRMTSLPLNSLEAAAGRVQRGRQEKRRLRAEEEGKHKMDSLHRLLLNDPEVRVRLDRVRRAASLVADIQAQRTAFDEEAQSARNASPSDQKRQEERQAQRAAGRGANEDVMRAADELEMAKAAYAEAAMERNKWALAADEEAERLESAKAGAVAAAAATVASSPFILATSSNKPLELASSLAIMLLSGLLFGVTYRYAVRQDQNLQLKGGVVAAFGLARGAALAESFLKEHSDAILSVQTLAAASLLCAQSLITFAFAAAALEAGFQRGFLSQFRSPPSNRTS